MSGMLLTSLLGVELRAQLPGIQWQRVEALGERPPGRDFTWNNDDPPTYSASAPQPLNTAVPPGESGVDWYNDVCLVRDDLGAHIGYAVAGFSFILNWGYDDGDCGLRGIWGSPSPLNLETPERRRGNMSGTIAYYDLDGVQQWYHSYYGGAFQGIIQDKNGDLVVTGWIVSTGPWPDVPWAEQALYYNPEEGEPLEDMADLPCTDDEFKMAVLKVSVDDGHVIWSHL